jgi:general secretion pathway protein K
VNRYTCAHFPNRQRGVALLVALLVVALATILIAALLDRGELTAARTRNQLRAAQAQAYAEGLEAYAARVLQQDRINGEKVDTATDAWAVPLPPTPVPGGEIEATMSDLSGRFNLNNMSPDYPQHDIWEKKFRLLLQALKLDPNLTLVVHDWMSRDAASGSNDAFYLSQPVPYRSAKNIFFHISELRLLRGMSGAAYAQLAPHVSALPPGTSININTATVPVLMTMREDMTQQMAQALWQQGQANFRSIGDVGTLVPAFQPECAGATRCYDVYSSFFVARGQITLDGLPFVFYSVLDRIESGPDGGVHVIQRSRGTDG